MSPFLSGLDGRGRKPRKKAREVPEDRWRPGSGSGIPLGVISRRPWSGAGLAKLLRSAAGARSILGPRRPAPQEGDFLIGTHQLQPSAECGSSRSARERGHRNRVFVLVLIVISLCAILRERESCQWQLHPITSNTQAKQTTDNTRSLARSGRRRRRLQMSSACTNARRSETGRGASHTPRQARVKDSSVTAPPRATPARRAREHTHVAPERGVQASAYRQRAGNAARRTRGGPTCSSRALPSHTHMAHGHGAQCGRGGTDPIESVSS